MTTNETLKSTTLELTINPGYVRGWQAWEATRELIQNALDSDDQGYRMSIERGAGNAKTIYITNEGVTLPRSALLLGTTTKDSGGFRGKFGEGLKLAFLVLCRLDIKVQVRTGSEMWTPFIEHSDVFGADILKVKIRPAAKHEEKIEIQIHGLCDADWETIQSRLLNVPGLAKTQAKKDEVIEVGGAKILTGERFRGRLFARGLFVAKLPDAHAYGYDFPNVQLDRDRGMADTWSVRYHLKEVLARAIETEKLSHDHVLGLMSQDCGEASMIAAYYVNGGGCTDALTKGVTKAFREKHGEETVPVGNMAESIEAEHHGLKGVMVPAAVKLLVEVETGKFAERKSKRDLDARTLYGASELTAEERANLMWASNLITAARPDSTLERVQIVDFYGEKVCGTYEAGTRMVRVARKLLVDRREVLSTLVHEFAHEAGGDGSLSHERTIERLFAEIVVRATT